MMGLEVGKNDLAVVKLTDGKGATAEVYAHGAHLTKYSINGKDIIFVSRNAVYKPPKAIRGGVPVCLPQFAQLGTLQQHGFARNTSWEVVSGSGDKGAVLELEVTLQLQEQYMYTGKFKAVMQVSFTPDGHLQQQLSVTNTADSVMDMTTALHTYFAVSDAATVRVVGLQGCQYFDSVNGGAQCKETNEAIQFPGEVDRVYVGVPNTIKLEDPGHRHSITLILNGFPDAVVWNPGPAKAAAMSDMADEEYKDMVCIEAALARSGPVNLQPGETWKGSQVLQVSNW